MRSITHKTDSGRVFYDQRQDHVAFRTVLEQLQTKVTSQFKNNPSIKYIPSKDYVVEDNGIQFVIKILETLRLKPMGDKERFEQLKTTEAPVVVKKDDPFVAPFEEGLFIDEITDTHSLVFNKFSVCDDHVIVITTDF